MTQGKLIDFKEQRRANRMDWERPVTIIKPIEVAGWAINVSAIGLLMRIGAGHDLHQGDQITVEIPRMDGTAITQRNARIVRLEPSDSELLLGLELLF